MRTRVLVLALVLGVGAPAAAEEPAEVIFENARFYVLAGAPRTDAEDEPVVEAIAVSRGRIVAAGSRAAVERWRGPRTRRVDLHGGVAFPGMVDAHAHVSSLGRTLRQLDLTGTRTYDEVVARTAARAAREPAGTWIEGRGWDQNDWPDPRFPDHTALSERVPDHPVYLRRVDGHAALVNQAALDRSGITAATPDPPGGRIVRRADGSPTGVLVDTATDLVAAHIPAVTARERRLRLRRALDHAAATGITGIHDAGISLQELEEYRHLLAAGELPLRIYAMLDLRPDADLERNRAYALEHGPQPFDPTMHLALRTVKLALDGALGSRGAALLADYSDAPGERGLPQYTPDAFLNLLRPLHARGFQIATHAIGDAANRMALDAYAVLQREHPRADARHRVEHAQVLHPDDIPRFAALHVLPSMQPTHCTSDMPWAGRRVGPQRLQGAYAWRALRDTGVILPAGSDAPVEFIDPRYGLYAAVTRQDPSGMPAGGWQPEQRLTRPEALRAFTSWAARASFTEDQLGTLEPGKWADLSVFDRDLMQVPARELLEARCTFTVVGGEIVYGAPEAGASPAARR